MAKTPAFRHMGGKARLREWLIGLFPKTGYRYIEPFAGKGNVFYLVKQNLDYNYYILNDLDGFLCVLKTFDCYLLPEKINKKNFSYWKKTKNKTAKILEPRITFAGKGYKFGFSGSSGTHVGYDKKNYTNNCQIAINLLQKTDIYRYDYYYLLSSLDITENDFIYFDPPYYNTKTCYNNIDHEKLIKLINKLKCNWALSGYASELYTKNLKYKNKYVFERNSEIKSSNKGERVPVNEILWTNY